MVKNRKIRWVALLVALLIAQLAVPGCRKNQSGATTAKSVQTTAKTSATAEKTTARTATKTAVTSASGPIDENTETGNAEENQNQDTGTEEKDKTGTVENGPFASLKFNPEKMDLGGRTMKFMLRSIPAPKETNEKQAIFWKRIENTEKLFNVKIEFSQTGIIGTGFDENFYLQVIAGLYVADVVHNVSFNVMPRYVKSRAVIPLDDYIDYDNSIWAVTEPHIQYLDGKHYSMATVDSSSNPGFLTTYNLDILNQEGIEDILELYKKGQWNWEMLLDISIKCTKDFNGDGLIDQWGFNAGRADSLLISNGLVPISMSGSGSFENAYTDPRAYRAFNFYRDLAFIYKVVAPGTSWGVYYRQNKVAIDLGSNNPSFTTSFGMRNVKVAPLPFGPDVTEPRATLPFIQCYAVPSSLAFKPEEVIAVYRYSIWNNPEDPEAYLDPALSGFPKNFPPEYYLVAPEDETFWTDWYTNRNLNVNYIQAFPDFSTIVNSKIVTAINAGELYSSIIESYKTELQSNIDKYIN